MEPDTSPIDTEADQFGIVMSYGTWMILILILAAAVRLYRVNAPYLDAAATKQLTVFAIARNYAEGGIDFLRPRADWMPYGPNYIEGEFQLVPAVAALLYRIFGVHEWIGRSVAIAFSLASIFCMAAVIRLLLGNASAAWGALFLALAPLNVVFGRTFMPESALLAFCAASLWCFLLWLQRPHWLLLVGGVGALTMAVLLKPTAVTLLAPLAYAGFAVRGWRFFRDWRVWTGLIVALALAVAHYLHAHQLGSQSVTMGVWSAPWRLRVGQLLPSPPFWALMLWRFSEPAFTPVGFALLVVGFGAAWREPKLRVFAVWLLGLGATVLVTPGSYEVNGYYLLPFLLPAAGLIGWTWHRLSLATSMMGAVLLAVVLALTAVRSARDMYVTDTSPIEAGAALSRIAPESATVVVYPSGYVVAHYIGRPTWSGRGEYGDPSVRGAGNPAYLESCIERGATFAVYLIHPDRSWDDPLVRTYLESHFPVIERGERFVIFDLRRRVPRRITEGRAAPQYTCDLGLDGGGKQHGVIVTVLSLLPGLGQSLSLFNSR